MSPARMERFESSIRIALEFNEAFNRRYVAGMQHLLAEDCVFENHDPAPDGAVCKGKESIAQFYQVFFEGSPNACNEIEDIFGFGVHCVVRWRLDDEQRHLRGVTIFQVKEKLIHEILTYVKG